MGFLLVEKTQAALQLLPLLPMCLMQLVGSSHRITRCWGWAQWQGNNTPHLPLVRLSTTSARSAVRAAPARWVKKGHVQTTGRVSTFSRLTAVRHLFSQNLLSLLCNASAVASVTMSPPSTYAILHSSHQMAPQPSNAPAMVFRGFGEIPVLRNNQLLLRFGVNMGITHHRDVRVRNIKSLKAPERL